MPRFARGARGFAERQRAKRVAEEAAASARAASAQDDAAPQNTDCVHCSRGGPDVTGIQCDNESCNKWSCISCLDRWLPTSCPEDLYVALDAIGEFPFVCHLCNPDRNLPQQLLDAGVLPADCAEFPTSRYWLECCGVAPEVLDCQPGQVHAVRTLLLQRRQQQARRSPPLADPAKAQAQVAQEGQTGDARPPLHPLHHQPPPPPAEAHLGTASPHQTWSQPHANYRLDFHTPLPEEPAWDIAHHVVPSAPYPQPGGPSQRIARPVPSFPSAFRPPHSHSPAPGGFGAAMSASGHLGLSAASGAGGAPLTFGPSLPLHHVAAGMSLHGGPGPTAAPAPTPVMGHDGRHVGYTEQASEGQAWTMGRGPVLISPAPPVGLQPPLLPQPLHAHGAQPQRPHVPGQPPAQPLPQPGGLGQAGGVLGGPVPQPQGAHAPPLGPQPGAHAPPFGPQPGAQSELQSAALLQQTQLQNQALWNMIAQQQGGQRGLADQPRTGLQMPKVKIPSFSGKQTDFPLWWNQFRSRVHENPSVARQNRMDCLVSALEGGEAAQMIAGYMGLVEHYDAAVETLLRRFNNPFLLQEKLWLELEAIPNVRGDLSNAQVVFDTLNAKVQMLRACGAVEVEMDNWATRYARRQTNSFLLSLFYAERMHGAGTTMLERWQMDELLRVLERLLGFVWARGDAAANASGRGGSQSGGGSNNADQRRQRDRSDRSGRGNGRSNQPGAQASTAPQATGPAFSLAMAGTPAAPPPARRSVRFAAERGPSERAKCAFCQSSSAGHLSTGCTAFATPEQRRTRAMELRLCLNCLAGESTGGQAQERGNKSHWARNCPSKGTCNKCQRRHHTALHDPSYVPAPRERGGRTPEPNMSNVTVDEDSDLEPFFSVEPSLHNSSQAQTGVVDQTPAEAHAQLRSHKDTTKMMTMVAEMVNPQTGEAVPVNVLLDGGAKSHSVLARHVQGPPFLPALGRPKTRRIGRYGSTDVFTQSSQLTEFILRSKTGAQIALCAYSSPAICPDLTLKPLDLSPKDQATVDAHRCLNAPPKTPQTFPVDVCIGQEDLNSILNHPGSFKVHLEGSLTIHVTAFGALLDGSRLGSLAHKTVLGPEAGGVLTLCDDQMEMERRSAGRKRAPKLLPLYNAPITHQLMATETLPGLETVRQPSLEGVENLFRSFLVGIEGEEGRKRDEDYEMSIVRRFAQNHIRLVDLPNGKQRYEVKLLWKNNLPKNYPNSFPAAFKCAERVLKKLCPDGEVTSKLDEYDKPFRIYEERKMISQIPEEQIGWLGYGFSHLTPAKAPPTQPLTRPTFWLQHFPRYKEASSFSRCRPVFNASHPSGPDKTSLNSNLEPGPDIMGKLTVILLNNRVPPVAVSYDMEKAYLSCGLAEEDRAATRFVWLKEKRATLENNVALMQFEVLPFGLAPAAFLLHLAIGYHLDMNPGPLADRIRHRYYQDNFFASCLTDPGCDSDKPTSRDAVKLYKGVKELFAKVSMNLREFASNCQAFNDSLPPEDRHPQLDKEEPEVGMLGLVWRTKEDTLAFPKASDSVRQRYEHISRHSLWTKRLLCVFVAKLSWDPLGLISPCTLPGRLLIQRYWVEHHSWDEILPSALQTEASAAVGELFGSHEVRVPRRVLADHQAAFHLVVVADASELAIAALVFVWQPLPDGRISSCLAMAKTKNALKAKEVRKPLRTVPELELNSYVMGIRLAKYVEKGLGGHVEGLHLMGDSQLVLFQLKNQRRLKPYVQRRATEIMDAGPTLHFLPTHENCADLGTRGCTLSNLPNTWWHGPEIIQKHHAKDWPPFDPGKEGTEKLESELQLLNMVEEEQGEEAHVGPFGLNAQDFSSLRRLLNRTGWVLRAVQRFRGQRGQPKHLTPGERKEALNLWVRHEQSSHYADTKRNLEKGKVDRLTKEMDLHLDDGIIRLGGRLDLSPLSWSAKHPALLGRKTHLGKLAILDAHARVHHGGYRESLNFLRTDLWIPKGNVEAKKALKQCGTCRLVRGGSLRPPKMGQIPSARLTPTTAWSHVGADCAGPFGVKIRMPTGDVLTQIHVLVITDLFSRAVALEPIWDQTAEELMLAFQRHFSRRGRASQVWSDNAASLLKTEKVMKTEKTAAETADALGMELSNQQIIWHHTPPVAPWAAGVWEIMVKLTKKILKASLWRRTVTFSSFTSLLAAAEAVLNTRPICPVSGSLGPHDNVLTPAHLACGSDRLLAPFFPDDPDPDPDWTPESSPARLSKAFTRGQNLINQARSMMMTQYIIELRCLHRSHFKHKRGQVPWKPTVGQIYLVEEKGKDRQTWRRCLVSELLPGKDGECRFAKVLLASPTGGRSTPTVRAIQLLVPLEAQIEEDSQPQNPPQDQTGSESAPVTRTEEKDERTGAAQDQTNAQPQAHPMKTRSQAKKSGMGAMTVAAMSLLLCFVLPSAAAVAAEASAEAAGPAHALPNWLPTTTFLCPDGGGHILNLPDLAAEKAACMDTAEAKPTSTEVTVYRSSNEAASSPAILCSVEEVSACTACTLLRVKSMASLPVTTRKPLSAEECALINATQQWRDNQLSKDAVAKNLFSTKLQLKLQYSNWGTKCSSVTNVYLERTKVWSGDGRGLASAAADVSGCALAKGRCVLPHAVLLWHGDFWKRSCPWAVVGTFQATIAGLKLNIPDLQVATTISGPVKNHACLPKAARLTSQHFAIVIHSRQEGRAKQRHTRALDPLEAAKELLEQGHSNNVTHHTLPAEASEPGYPTKADIVGGRINYGLYNVHKQFHQEHRSLCLLNVRLWQMSLASLRASPTESVREWLGEPALKAAWLGPRLVVRGCHVVHLRKVFEDFNVGLICYELLPVLIEGSEDLHFIGDASGELAKQSPKVRCEDRPKLPSSHGTLSWPSLGLNNELGDLKAEVKDRLLSDPPALHAHPTMPREAVEAWARSVPRLLNTQTALINYSTGAHGGNDELRQALVGLGEAAVVMGNGSVRMLTHLGSDLTTGVGHMTQGLLTSAETAVSNVLGGFNHTLTIIGAAGLVVLAWYTGIFDWLKQKWGGEAKAEDRDDNEDAAAQPQPRIHHRQRHQIRNDLDNEHNEPLNQ